MTDDSGKPLVQLVVSPAAGSGKALSRLPELIETLGSHGFRAEAVVTRGLDHGRELAYEAARVGARVVAVGGDGLVGRVVSGVYEAGGDSPVGIIPMGTGNDFCRALGIDSISTAVSAITNGTVRQVDVGMLGSTLFTCAASLGFDTRVLDTAARLKFVRGRVLYPLATVVALARWKPMDFTLVIDGETVECRGYNVVVANGAFYGGGMKIAPHARIDDQRFEVVVIGDVSRGGFLQTAPKVFSGRHIEHPKVWTRTASTVQLVGPEGESVVADGEHGADCPTDVTFAPRTLPVLCPALVSHHRSS